MKKRTINFSLEQIESLKRIKELTGKTITWLVNHGINLVIIEHKDILDKKELKS